MNFDLLERIVEIYIIYIEEWKNVKLYKGTENLSNFVHITVFIYTWLNHTPVNGVLHCKLCFIFNMFENKISLLTSLFESEFDFQSSVLHCKFLLREHFNTKSHYCNHDDVLSWTLWKKKKGFYTRSTISY